MSTTCFVPVISGPVSSNKGKVEAGRWKAADSAQHQESKEM